MRICFFFLFVLCWNNSWAIDIEIYTENWPPLNFENGGKITGFTTDIVREIQRRTKIKGEIKLLPWKRAYFNALNKKNALIYSIVRNPQREGLFRWVGPIYPRRVSLFKLKSRRDIIVKNVKDLGNLCRVCLCNLTRYRRRVRGSTRSCTPSREQRSPPHQPSFRID